MLRCELLDGSGLKVVNISWALDVINIPTKNSEKIIDKPELTNYLQTIVCTLECIVQCTMCIPHTEHSNIHDHNKISCYTNLNKKKL
ncbi:hypothetical protein A3Q56_06182 [Intoshia linei]|uniref:Uncharacterized protein n=1 Tax=Intoshia linei TaxID=1819745 RepID=A0A177AXD3_9BILA|nr:hypothetical protein A3Q56_06182 [Intoshia linei]